MTKEEIIVNEAIYQMDCLNRRKAIGLDEYNLIKGLLENHKNSLTGPNFDKNK